MAGERRTEISFKLLRDFFFISQFFLKPHKTARDEKNMIQLIASCRERKTDSRFSFFLGRFPFQSGSHAFKKKKKINFGVFYSRFELSTNESRGEGKKKFFN